MSELPVSVLNFERAKRFTKVLQTVYGNTDKEGLMDALSDAMHFCRVLEINFDEILEVAVDMYFRDTYDEKNKR